MLEQRRCLAETRQTLLLDGFGFWQRWPHLARHRSYGFIWRVKEHRTQGNENDTGKRPLPWGRPSARAEVKRIDENTIWRHGGVTNSAGVRVSNRHNPISQTARPSATRKPTKAIMPESGNRSLNFIKLTPTPAGGPAVE